MNAYDKEYIDLVGQTIGHWEVLRKVPREEVKQTNTNAHFECRCKCGTLKIINSNVLRRGESKQCHPCAGKDAYKKRVRNGKN